MTLQLSHIFLTDALTFILALPCCDAAALPGKSCGRQTVILTSATATGNPRTEYALRARGCSGADTPARPRLCYLVNRRRVVQQRQDLGTLLGNRHRVLEMRGRLAI